MEKTVVVGATGDVGQGITAQLLKEGRQVVAVGRSPQRLGQLADELGADAALTLCPGDISDATSAARLVETLTGEGGVGDVVVSVNGPAGPRPLAEADGDHLAEIFAQNVLPHFEAAKAFIPNMSAGSTYLSIGGGMADFIVPGMLAISMAQAAQRNLFRHLHAQPLRPGVRVAELMLYSMIAGRRSAARTRPDWITAEEVGRHVAAVLADPEAFKGPILKLRSREQVGRPETA